MKDTIVNISTSQGKGAISIIRISGSKAIEIVNNIFSKNILKEKSHTIHYGYIMDKNKKIDEVLISIMKAPKTYTKEDIVEINTHGGIISTNKVLELLLYKGCRLAEPGEFTKRAFLNGRIDLIEAEGVMDLINAKSEKANELALNQISGRTSSLIKSLRESIIEILANIEVNIDYPEYEDIEEYTIEKLTENIKNIKEKIKEILEKSKNGKIVKEGINVAIIGSPNVGKSSLLNELLEEEKAIVTNIKGTTRDIIEGEIIIDGILINLIDTAGIRNTKNEIEIIGVQKSLKTIEKADLVLYVLSNSEKLKEYDKKILEKIQNKPTIVIINKMDLERKLKLPKNLKNYLEMSILEKKGIEELKNKIKEIFKLGEIETKDLNYLTNIHHITALKECLDLIKNIENGIKNKEKIDMLEIDLKIIWNKLGTITGESYDEELIDKLFSQFCLGK